MRSSIKKVVIIIGIWTLLALLFTPQTYLLNLRTNNPLTWFESFYSNTVIFYLWGALTPLIWRLGKKLPIEKPNQWLNFTIIFLLGFPCALLHIFLFQQTGHVLSNWMTIYQTPLPISSLVVGIGATNMMFYWIIIIISQADIYFRRYHEREQSLVQAQLQALKTQLHPHFLFNALNAISQLLYENEEEAEKTISQLSDLLRFSLKGDQKQEVTLREELDFLQMYLEIQQTLLQDRLKIIWRVVPETLESLIPNMILQPLVENAIRHGIAPRLSGGTIKIIANQEGNWLNVRICDDGLGYSKSKNIQQFGIGLSNTRQRLRHLYGKDHTFQIKPALDGKGVTVFLKIPFRNCEQGKVYENPHFDSGRYVIGAKAHPTLSEQGF